MRTLGKRPDLWSRSPSHEHNVQGPRKASKRKPFIDTHSFSPLCERLLASNTARLPLLPLHKPCLRLANRARPCPHSPQADELLKAQPMYQSHGSSQALADGLTDFWMIAEESSWSSFDSVNRLARIFATTLPGCGASRVELNCGLSSIATSCKAVLPNLNHIVCSGQTRCHPTSPARCSQHR